MRGELEGVAKPESPPPHRGGDCHIRTMETPMSDKSDTPAPQRNASDEAYDSYLAKHAALLKMSGRHYVGQESRYVHPFQIFGNVWYVGDDWVCVHLIDTGDGLLLLDSGNIGASAMLVNAIWEAGFRPADVRWIIHSHGHLDHIGAAGFFKRMFGTKLLLGAPDAEMFRERPSLSLLQCANNAQEALFEPDAAIRNGDRLVLGKTTLDCRLVPGHTAGCVALFFDAHDGAETRRCGYYGGFGFNTLKRAYLESFGFDVEQARQTYLDSLAKVRDEKVEIFLGNHCQNNDTIGRRKRQLENPGGPNPFIDPDAWRLYLDSRREELLALIARD